MVHLVKNTFTNYNNHNKHYFPVVTLEMKDLFTRFTNDAIASAAFGIEVNSLKYPNNEFYLMGKDITNFTSVFKLLRIVIYEISPNLYDVSIQ